MPATSELVQLGCLVFWLALESSAVRVLLSSGALIQQCPHPPLLWHLLTGGGGGAEEIKQALFMSRSFFCIEAESRRHGRVAAPSSGTTQDLTAVPSWLAGRSQEWVSTLGAVYGALSTYATYIIVLLIIYVVPPTALSLGYLLCLLFWVLGRQLATAPYRQLAAAEQQHHLWLPLLIYAGLVLSLRYLSLFDVVRRVAGHWLGLSEEQLLQLGFSWEAGMPIWQALWDTTLVLGVIQFYRYGKQRTQMRDPSPPSPPLAAQEDGGAGWEEVGEGVWGWICFGQRVLILHSGKVAYLVGFWAAIERVTVIGGGFLVLLVGMATVPKTSRLPGNVLAIYAAVFTVAEYSFQMWGHLVGMGAGQPNAELASVRGTKSGRLGVGGGWMGRGVVHSLNFELISDECLFRVVGADVAFSSCRHLAVVGAAAVPPRHVGHGGSDAGKSGCHCRLRPAAGDAGLAGGPPAAPPGRPVRGALPPVRPPHVQHHPELL